MQNDKTLGPKYAHDCNKCVFLGHFTYIAPQSGVHKVDLYWCSSSSTIIARESSELSDYASTPTKLLEERAKESFSPTGQFSTADPALMAGYALWKLRKGLIG